MQMRFQKTTRDTFFVQSYYYSRNRNSKKRTTSVDFMIKMYC